MKKYIIKSYEGVMGSNFHALYCPNTITKKELEEKINIAQKYVEKKYDIEDLIEASTEDFLLDTKNELIEIIGEELLNDPFFDEMKKFIELSVNGREVFNYYMTLCGCIIEEITNPIYDFEYEW